ncbi:MAG: thrombospondin type 3 repeat-containing protein [Kiritimatiellae bacterium]|nr:thrombospondin type 3 repeat-containing protein [Kiritimatiellia bacterium]
MLPNDSAAIGVQHLGVLKLFALPGAGDSDMDGDGLPDSWELDYFDTLEVLNSIYDFDGDGLSDYGEYVAGTDPTDPDSLFQLSRFEPQEGAQIEIVWPSASNRQYSVWYSDDTLYNFQLAISNILATPPINTLQLNLSSPASARFYRIEVQWP